ncbi:MAG: radical SAM protein [Nitrospirota bacterium]
MDDNFTANKARTKELLRAMIAEKFNYCWSAQVRTDVARDEELLGLLADAGCETVQIGFESVNPKTLEAFNKKQNLDEIVESIRKVHDYGIKIHGMFVFGSDLDTVDTIKQTADFAIKHRIDTIQFMMLTPLPGTPFFTEMKDSDRLLHTQWDKYDAHHVVYKPLLMTPQALHMESLKAMGRFYSWKYIFDHAAKLDFFYAAVGLYGKQAVRKALKEARGYLDSIGALVESPLPDPPPTTS